MYCYFAHFLRIFFHTDRFLTLQGIAVALGLTMCNLSHLGKLAFAVYCLSLGFGSAANAHSGIVDGYGCHRGHDKASYHCHQGQFAGRTFKSKEDFLRELRGGKSPRLAPKSNQPLFEKKADD